MTPTLTPRQLLTLAMLEDRIPGSVARFYGNDVALTVYHYRRDLDRAGIDLDTRTEPGAETMTGAVEELRTALFCALVPIIWVAETLQGRRRGRR